MARFLADRSRLVGGARVRGQLFDLGRFPGMLPSAGEDDWVTGELVELHDVQDTLTHLDRYEDSEGIFPRRRSTALLADGSTRETWVYFYAGPMDHAVRIASGDYFAAREKPEET